MSNLSDMLVVLVSTIKYIFNNYFLNQKSIFNSNYDVYEQIIIIIEQLTL